MARNERDFARDSKQKKAGRLRLRGPAARAHHRWFFDGRKKPPESYDKASRTTVAAFRPWRGWSACHP